MVRAPLPALTGVRALAAAWVLLFHLRPWLPPLPGPLARVVGAGYLGVDLFFVLSGYVLAHNYLDPRARPRGRGALRFWMLRLARIYPLHLALTLAMVVLALLRGAGDDAGGGGALLAHLALVHAWTGDAVTTWNVPSWSISAEWFAYLLFPLLAAAVVRIRDHRIALAGAALAYVSSGLALAALRPGELDVTAGAALIRIAGPFTAGVLLAHASALGALPRVRWDDVADLGALALGVHLLALGEGRALAPLFGGWVLALARAPGARPGVARLLGRPALLAAGERSYALYLVHGPVMVVVTAVRPDGVLGALAIVAGSVAAAGLLFRHLEEPARAALRRVLDRPHRRPRPTFAPESST